LDDGVGNVNVKRRLIFESAWLTNVEFMEILIERWPMRSGEGVQDF
jgi:hypothetical protein